MKVIYILISISAIHLAQASLDAIKKSADFSVTHSDTLMQSAHIGKKDNTYINSYAPADVVITQHVTYTAGTYYFNGNIIIEAGATLTFESGCSNIFTYSNGTIYNHGTLEIIESVITPGNTDDCWGHIYTFPGSTTTISDCTLNKGGGSMLPPLDNSNGVLYVTGGDVEISTTAFTEPTGNSIGITGGKINCMTNNLVSHKRLIYQFAGIQAYNNNASIYASCRGNYITNTGDGYNGFVVDGLYTHDITLDSPDIRINAFDIHVSNCVLKVMTGTQIGFYDYLPGSLTIDNNGELWACGSENNPVILSNFYGKNPWYLRLLSNSKTYFDHAYVYRPAVFDVSNAYLCISNTFFAELNNGLNVHHQSELRACNSTFSDIVNLGIDISNQSTGIFRQCQFVDNNVPFIKTLESDEKSFIDARLCWWNAADGPYPYGAYGNEYVRTNNTTVYVFPWLSAVPDSQDKPPILTIITPTSDQYTTTEPQLLIEGTAYDDTGIERVIYRTFKSQFSANASYKDTTIWNAEAWLFEGVNQIGVYAFDEDGNSAVASLLINCTGKGAGMNSQYAPVLLTLADKKVNVGETVSFSIAAVSQHEPSIISYWAGTLPTGAFYNATTHTFTWTPREETIENVSFYATDGTYTNKETVTITVSDDPQPIVLNPDMPKAYEHTPFFMWLVADNCEFPVKWQHSNLNMRSIPSGMAVSRAGFIGGIPTSMNTDMRVNFATTVIDAQFQFSDENQFTIDVLNSEPPSLFDITTTDIPVVSENTDIRIQLSATNGIPPYTWQAVDSYLNECGLTLTEDGILTGRVVKAGLFPFYAVVTDATNRSTAAYISIPVIDTDNELEYIAGKNKFKAVIKRPLDKAQKCSFMFKAMVAVPNVLPLADNDVLTVRVGDILLDLTQATKYKAGKIVMMKFMRAQGGEKIKALLKQKPDGTMKVKFIWKKMDLNYAFERYGVVDEEVKEKRVDIPVWLRVANGMTITEEYDAEVKSKAGKVTRVKSKW